MGKTVIFLMSQESRCPECNTPIPSSIPGGNCPLCLLRSSLESAFPINAEIPIESNRKNLKRSQNVVGEDLAGEKTDNADIFSRHSKLKAERRRLRRLQWVFFVAFILITVYAGARLFYAQGVTRTSFVFNNDLGVVFDLDDYGLQPDHRLIAVNDQVVQSREEIYRALRGGPLHRAKLEFARGESTAEDQVELEWIMQSTPPVFEVDDDGQVVWDRLTESSLNTSGTEQIVSILDRPVRDLAEPGFDQDSFRRSRMRFEIKGVDESRQVLIYALDWRAYWTRLVVGVLVGFLGVGAFWIKPNNKSALGFVAFCIYLGLVWYARAIPFHHKLTPELFGFHGLLTFLFLPSAMFLAVFSPYRLIVGRLWPIAIVASALGILFISSNAAFDPTYARYGLLATPIFLAWAGCFALMILVTVPADQWFRMAGISLKAIDRQRANIIRIATVVGFVPTVIYAMIRMRWETGFEVFVATELSVVAFPLIIGYAVVRHNLLQISDLIREGLLYGSILALLVGAYALSVGILVPAVQDFIPGGTQFVTTAVVVATVVLVIPLHARARKEIERRLNRVRFDYDSIRNAVEADTKPDTLPHEFCVSALPKLARAAGTENGAIFLLYGDSHEWSIGSIQPMPETGLTTETCVPLLELIEKDQNVINRDDFVESIAITARQLSALHSMDSIGAIVAIPLVVQQRLIGVLALGEKVNGRNFSATEMTTLDQTAQHIASTLSNLMMRQQTAASTRIVDIFPDLPENIGPYNVQSVLGEGGMSYVYLGTDGEEHAVAIKVAKHMVQADAGLMERFHREARAMRRLNHPNIVQIVELGWHGKEPFIVLEHFPDGSIDKRLKQKGPFPELATLQLIMGAAKGLEAALNEGIVHRDIKPQNLFIDEDNVVKIGDFGLARIAEESTLTQAGDILGTPDYMSPEVMNGNTSSWKSDQYALGVTMFELLTGTKPFQAESLDALIVKYMTNDIPKVKGIRREITAAASKIVETMTARNPNDRYSTYAELIRELGLSFGDTNNS
jgi:hypothetical protein